MNKGIKLLPTLILGLVIASCSSPSKMVELADNVKVTCNPAVLEVVAGNIDAEVTVTYPEGYFHPKAILEVTPVLVYNGGEAALKPIVYQGSKLKENYTPISKEGKTVTEKLRFRYVPGMEKAELELRSSVSYKDKKYNLPVRKIAVGTNTTYMLAETEGYLNLKKDNYQEIIKQTEEGQIRYSVNSSVVSNKEMKSQSVKDFQAALDEIRMNARKTLKSTEVVAYASPEGGKSYNDKLSDKRSKSADKVWNKVIKGVNLDDVKSVGQDWEGFQSLVENSDIQDKDLIIRVLSMYSDPAVRESEIRNMSQIFTSLKKTVLPELRRARFIANVEYKNYTRKELLKLVEDNIDILDEEALLRAATLVSNTEDKINLYKKAVSKYGSDRAQYNLAVSLLQDGNLAEGEAELAKVSVKDSDYENVLGVIAMRKGDYMTAERHFAKADTDDAKKNVGVISILKGDYKKAASQLEGKGACTSYAVACILSGNPEKAFDAIKCECPKGHYVKAVAAARLNDSKKVGEELSKAAVSDTFKKRMADDIEFARYNITIK